MVASRCPRRVLTVSAVLLLDAEATAIALEPLETLAAVRQALVAISRDVVSAPPRIAARAPDGLLGCMPAHVPGLGLAAKLVSIFSTPGSDPGDGGRSSHHGLVAVFDEHDGRPVAIIEGGTLTAVRTAAAATVSLLGLAPAARRIAVLGAGVQAEAQLELLRAVLPEAEVVVGARDPDAGGRVAAAFPGAGVASIREAVRGAEAVLCCTGATSPVLERSWLAPGTYVSSVGGSGGHEVDAATVAAATLYVEWSGAAGQPPPAGAHELQGVDPARVRLVGSVLDTGGVPPGRDLTLFKSTGHAALDVAAGSVALRRARKLGLGRTLPF